MSVWSLQIHDDKVGGYCLDNNVAAMGWSFKELDEFSDSQYDKIKEKINSLTDDNWENFTDCAEAMEYDFDCVIKLHDEVREGDFVWMFFNGRYYVARVDKESKWHFSQEAREIEAANQLTNLQWHYVGKDNALVPSVIENAFLGEKTFKKILDYDVEAFSAWLVKAFESKDFVEPINIWRLLTHTSGGDISQYCLDNNVAAMGWSFRDLKNDPDLEESVSKIETWEDFQACSEAYYDEVNLSVKRLHDDVNAGDVILMRSQEGRYYFAVVDEKSEWRFNHEPESIEKDAANQLTEIKWQKIKNVNSIADSLNRQFSFVGRTFRRTWKPEIWNFVLQMLKGK